MVKVVSRICPLDLMMKFVHFQVKKRLSHEARVSGFELSASRALSLAEDTCYA